MDIQGGQPLGTVGYTLRKGDSLSSLAQTFHTSEELLLVLNPGLHSEQLPVDVSIRVPLEKGMCPDLVYVVKNGDTLYRIAKQHGVKVLDIIRVNPFVDVYNLHVGTKLCLPREKKRSPTGTKTYTLQEDKTLTQILEHFDCSLEMLQAFNQGIETSHFYKGQVLHVPDKTGSFICNEVMTYVMGIEETLDIVASKLGQTTDALLKANPKLSPREFTAGTKIIVPDES